MHVVIFTTIYYNIYDMREREREREGGKTSAYHNLILYHLRPHKICVRLFHFKEYKRERERERQREDKQTFIIWSRIVYWELPFYNIHCHSLFVFFSQTVYMYVCQKVRVYYLFSNPLSIIVHQFAFCDTSVPLNFVAKLCAIWI